MPTMTDLCLVDSHCHFALLKEKNYVDVMQRAQALGVQYFLNVCVDVAEFDQIAAVADACKTVYASVGHHPNETTPVTIATLLQLAQHEKVIAIGETGLDYYRSTGDLDWQRQRFRDHIQAAQQVQKPLIIHTRAAQQDTIAIMQSEHADQVGGVMHCFTEDWDMAKQALDMGFYISFSGIVTFQSAQTIQTVAKQVPLDRMLLETDSPYLAPIPKRGKDNEPGYVRYTAEFIANLRNIPLETLAAATTRNFFELFKGAQQHV